MKRCFWVYFVFFVLFVSFSATFASVNICQHVALLANSNAAERSVTFYVKDIDKNTVLNVYVPKGTTGLSIFAENLNYKYVCPGPNVQAVLATDEKVSFSETGVFDAGDIIEFTYDSSGWNGPVGVNATWEMDPGSYASVYMYFYTVFDNGTGEEYILKLKTLTHVDLIRIDITVNGATFDPGSCNGTDLPDNNTISLGKPASDSNSGCTKVKSLSSPVNLGQSSSSGSSKRSASGTSGSSAAQCHYQLVCEPCGFDCYYPTCTYKKVCTSSGSTGTSSKASRGSSSKSAGGYTSGSVVRSPFSLISNRPSSERPKQTKTLPFWAKALSGKKASFGSSGGSSSSGTGTTTKRPVISGKSTFSCNAACISDPAKPKFYTDGKEYAIGEQVHAYVYVPEYESAVDVYMAVVDPDGQYWIVTVIGNSAVAYKYSESSSIKPYAVNLSSALNEWFYLNNVVPLSKTGSYTLYMLVVPAGTDLNSLNNYQLSSYEFRVAE